MKNKVCRFCYKYGNDEDFFNCARCFRLRRPVCLDCAAYKYDTGKCYQCEKLFCKACLVKKKNFDRIYCRDCRDCIEC